MTSLREQAEPTVKKLMMAEESQLYEQLGMRVKSISEEVEKAGSFEPEVIYDGAQMGAKDELREFGRRLFARWQIEAYKLVCGRDEEDQKDRK